MKRIALILVVALLAMPTALDSSRPAAAPALTWSATGGSETWDTSTANWNNNTASFATTDSVAFTSATGGTSMIFPSVAPASTTVSGTSGTCTFSGGPITAGTLAKSGAGTLAFSEGVGGSSTPTILLRCRSGGDHGFAMSSAL